MIRTGRKYSKTEFNREEWEKEYKLKEIMLDRSVSYKNDDKSTSRRSSIISNKELDFEISKESDGHSMMVTLDSSNSDDEQEFRRILSNKERHVEFSNEILNIFGVQTNKENEKTNWQPPNRSGLGNSLPIIQTKENKLDVVIQNGSSTKESPIYVPHKPQSSNSDDDLRSFFLNRDRPVQMSRNIKAALGFEETLCSSDNSNNSSTISNLELDDFFCTRDRPVSFSRKIRIALGYEDEDEKENTGTTTAGTDWRPPTKPGLNNSKPIINSPRSRRSLRNQ